MGSTIAIAYAIEHQSELNGLIVSGTTLKAGTSINKASILMAKIFSVLMPKIGVAALNAPISAGIKWSLRIILMTR